ncbi:MAG: glycosyltransferase family 39 protein [Planctomycetaceae bacterium]|nr:glycosyltransferase family 39 protein [Planctomycetaceae bacterium]
MGLDRFFVVLAAEVVGAYIVMYKNGYILNDAMARTANAYYVLNILPRKLASIGFVWNPLPSILQLPVLLFNDLWRPLSTHALAGGIVTAVFAAINASLLFRYFRREGINAAFALLVTALYAFNPFIFFYGSNGMSETIFFTVIIAGVYNFAAWLEDRVTNRLLVVALMLAMGFLTRYETLTLVLGFASSLLVVVSLMKDTKSPFVKKPFSMKFHYTVATSIVLFLPVLYVMAIWVIVCWTIMGDPFFFLHSAYSNESQAATAVSAVVHLRESIHSPANAMVYMAVHSLPFIFPFLLVMGMRLARGRLFTPETLVFILLIGCFWGFHYVLLLTGKSFGWLRFFSYAFPVALVWLPREFARMGKWASRLCGLLLVIGMTGSAALIPYYFSRLELANEEYIMFHHPEENGSAPQLAMAAIVNTKYKDAVLLMDSFTTSTLILNLDNAANLITTTSDNFHQVADDPVGHGVDIIILPRPVGVGLLDALNRRYPDMYNYGVPSWAELAESHRFYRLFRVIRDEEENEESGTGREQ